MVKTDFVTNQLFNFS